MRASLAEPITLRDLVRRTSVAERTLNEQFRAFVGSAPMQHLRRMRLAEARRRLLVGDASVTEIAQSLQFNHAGRFSRQYRAAFGETPSATLARCRRGSDRRCTGAGNREQSPVALPDAAAGRPDEAAIAVVVADPAGETATRSARHLGEVLVQTLSAIPQPSITAKLATAGPASSRSRYLMRVRQVSDHARLRIGFQLEDRATGAVLWSDRVDGSVEAPIALEDNLSEKVAYGIGSALRRVAVEQAARGDLMDLDARALAMRALPMLFSSTPEGGSRALQLLGRALELDPDSALVMALSAWAHAQRVMYTVPGGRAEDRIRARELVRRSAIFATDDPLEVTARAAVHMMLGDLDLAEALVARALALDPGFGWAWGRSGWLQAYRGNWTTALRHFRDALKTGPRPCRANILAGIGGAHFGAGRYDAAVRFTERALTEQPAMQWCNRSLSVCYDRLAERDMARRSAEAVRRYNPDITVSGIVASIPFPPEFLERLGNGLSDLGLPP